VTMVSLWLLGCAHVMADVGTSNPTLSNPTVAAELFLTGVDANYAPMMAEQGAVWKSGAMAVDLLPELRRNGVNAFRVRVWTRNDGPSGLTYATRLAAQAQAAGLQPYLVLFLSEDWSDLMKQPAPVAWRNLPFEQKLVQVRRYAARRLSTSWRPASRAICMRSATRLISGCAASTRRAGRTG